MRNHFSKRGNVQGKKGIWILSLFYLFFLQPPLFLWNLQSLGLQTLFVKKKSHDLLSTLILFLIDQMSMVKRKNMSIN